jgi:hypothetical protein
MFVQPRDPDRCGNTPPPMGRSPKLTGGGVSRPGSAPETYPMHGLDVAGRPLLAQLTPEAPLLRAAPVCEAATLQEGGGPTDSGPSGPCWGRRHLNHRVLP